MPLIDKPIAELHNYYGMSPCPADFEEYWDSSLRELDNHDPQVELVRDHTLGSRETECYDLWFTGIGGARVYARYVRPARVEKPAPAIVRFHGYSGSGGDWTTLLPYAAEGFCIAALDCRGQGGRSEDNLQIKGPTLRGHIIRGLDDPDPKKLLFRYIFLDTVLLTRIVMGFEEVDAERVGAMGGSQGGALTVACAALEPRIKAAAPVFPFLSDYYRVWSMDLAKHAYEELAIFFRHFDPLHQREDEIFERLGYIDIQNLAKRIHGKVLFTVGLMDPVCPPSTQFAAYNKITSEKSLIIYPDFGHESLPGNSDAIFRFLMNELNG